jgi:biopolymer transport protein ExbB
MNPSFQEPGVMTTVGEFFSAGGMLMWPILGCSVVVVGLGIERYLSLRKSRVVPQEVEVAVEAVRQGRADAISASVSSSSAPAARVLAAGLARRGCLLADVEKAMEDRLAEESALLRGNVRGITLMAAVAPLLGLLGTVVGIADAFAAVERTGLGKAHSSEALAAGIKVALYTTIFGLFVAIPATLVAAHLQSLARRLAGAIKAAVSPAIDPITRAVVPTSEPGAAAASGEETHAA